jgi:hypothetical protein
VVLNADIHFEPVLSVFFRSFSGDPQLYECLYV